MAIVGAISYQVVETAFIFYRRLRRKPVHIFDPDEHKYLLQQLEVASMRIKNGPLQGQVGQAISAKSLIDQITEEFVYGQFYVQKCTSTLSVQLPERGFIP